MFSWLRENDYNLQNIYIILYMLHEVVCAVRSLVITFSMSHDLFDDFFLSLLPLHNVNMLHCFSRSWLMSIVFTLCASPNSYIVVHIIHKYVCNCSCNGPSCAVAHPAIDVFHHMVTLTMPSGPSLMKTLLQISTGPPMHKLTAVYGKTIKVVGPQ